MEVNGKKMEEKIIKKGSITSCMECLSERLSGMGGAGNNALRNNL